MVMKNALIELGIPDKAITLDYAGFRTLDSIIRCKKIFDQDDITIITQSFHSYRALFISDYYNMESVAMVNYNGPNIPGEMRFREYLARTLAVFDLYVINREPKFLGKKETLNG
ncbi:MAG: ElyC/SanA/YdcF family protein [Bacteroidota bacterium]